MNPNRKAATGEKYRIKLKKRESMREEIEEVKSEILRLKKVWKGMRG